MRAPRLLTVLALAALPALPLAAGPDRGAGGVRVESLPNQFRAGDTVRLPEGWLRVEGPEEPGPAGSFAVAPAEELLPFSHCGERCEAAAVEGAPQPPPALPPPSPRRPRGMGLCEEERAAFMKELLRIAGVEVADPLALVAAFTGEGAGDVPSLRFPEWGLVPVDPVRALAWNFELQIRARELSQCVRDPGRPRIDPRFHPRGTAAPAVAPAAPSTPAIPRARAPDQLVARGE